MRQLQSMECGKDGKMQSTTHTDQRRIFFNILDCGYLIWMLKVSCTDRVTVQTAVGKVSVYGRPVSGQFIMAIGTSEAELIRFGANIEAALNSVIDCRTKLVRWNTL